MCMRLFSPCGGYGFNKDLANVLSGGLRAPPFAIRPADAIMGLWKSLETFGFEKAGKFHTFLSSGRKKGVPKKAPASVAGGADAHAPHWLELNHA